MIKVPNRIVAIIPFFDPEKIGHIYIPDQAKTRCKQGIVKYVGKDVEDIKIGDYVFFSGYAGIVFRLEGEGELIFMDTDNVLATLQRDIQIDIPGLYFRDKEGNYWNANYEQSMWLIATAVNASPFFQNEIKLREGIEIKQSERQR